MKAKDELGRRGEQLAADYLVQAGYSILERNWRCSQGEVDLVARLGDVTVFVEVKTRSGLRYGHPFEAITVAKLARLKRLSAAWCEARRAVHDERPEQEQRAGGGAGVGVGRGAMGAAAAARPARIRIDAIGVVAPPHADPVVEHLEGIF